MSSLLFFESSSFPNELDFFHQSLTQKISICGRLLEKMLIVVSHWKADEP